MKSDFDMIVRHFPENNDLTVYPISDLHIGAAEFRYDKWNAFKKQILTEPNSYITIGGDLMNNATRSSVSNIFEETMRPADQKKWLAQELEPLRDKILCAVSGNHERRSEKDADDNPLYDVLCKLDIEDRFRENIAFLKIQVGDTEKDGTRNPTYTIVVTHGAGGGILTGATVNRNERFGYVIDGMDCLIVGHTHKGALTKPQKINIDRHNNKVSFKDFAVISATSWLSFGGYAAQKMLLPSSQDLQAVTLCGREKRLVTRW